MDPIEAVWRSWLAPLGEDFPLDEALHRVAVEEGAVCTLARVQQQLDALAGGIPRDADRERTLARLVHRLFVEQRFRGDTEEYDHPQNSRLDLVLERKKGLPILLSAVTLEVARRVGLPLAGIGFPGHFLVGTLHEPRLFLDPFHGGRVYSATDLARQLKGTGQQGQMSIEQALEPTSSRDLLLRVSTNLMGSWLRRKEPTKALQHASRRVALRPEVPELLRDRGWLRAQLGLAELAAFDLAAYLEARPDAPDASRLRWTLSSLALGSD